MIRKLGIAVAAATALASGGAHAADYLLLIDGIQGESQMVGFANYNELESWSLGYTKGFCQALAFVKVMDSTSPAFTSAALLGTAYSQAILKALKTGGDGRPFVYLKLTMSNSVVTSYQTGGSSGSALLPFEQISLQPSSVLVEAFGQNADGSVVQLSNSSVTCQKVK